jgi:hypothetical protein
MPKIEYPKWLYHPNQSPRIVHGPEEHAALGPEWTETPGAVTAANDAADAPALAPEAGAANKRRSKR